MNRMFFTVIFIAMFSSVFLGYSGGSGTPENPYKIADANDLLALAAATADYNKCFILTADIDMNSQVFTTAIIAKDINSTDDFQGTAFTGVFDGNSFKITHFTINGAGNDYLGLFGCIGPGSSIKNLGLENLVVSGWSGSSFYVGSLAGYNDYGTISNCHSTGGMISALYSTGGLVGSNDGGSITNCYSTSTVDAPGSADAGGLVGLNSGSITNCYSTGTVFAFSSIGGLVGGNSYGSITNCYSIGAVGGNKKIGGLVGGNIDGNISNCYSTGVASGTSDVGGLVGYKSGGSVFSSYFLLGAGPDNGYGSPLTDVQMKQQTSFVGWDFTTPVWTIEENLDYPHLWWEENILYVPGRYPTIQSAIDAAVDGEVVCVFPGTYTGPGNRDIDLLGKAITVRSQSGPDNCIIDCNGTEEDLHRGFYFHSGEGQNSVLDGFTITNGCAYKGGAIKCDYYSSPTITNCIIRGNISPYVYVPDPFMPMIFLQDGGGIYCYESSPIIKKCCFIENTATAGGGAISSGDGNAYVDSCVFIGNRAALSGGAIELFGLYGDNMSVHNCIFTGNSAGGFDYYDGGYGGAIDCYSYDPSKPTIGNCTINGNHAVSNGGGIYGCGGSVTNCIIWDNWPDQLSGKSPIVTYSDVQDGYPGLGNIDAYPCFVEPGLWDANGTPADPNDDFWVDGDYHLKSEGWRWDTRRKVWTWDDVTSRCIDAGNPGSALADELLSIPDDPNNEWGQNLRINMGASGGTAEASIPPYDWALLADLTNDGTVDLTDFAYQAADWLNSADNQPGDLNRDGQIDIDDLALLTDDWLAQTSWHNTGPPPPPWP